jgi:hypothetical protein
MKRRRFKQSLTLEERLAEAAKRLRDPAKTLPPSAERDELICKAPEAEIASHMN